MKYFISLLILLSVLNSQASDQPKNKRTIFKKTQEVSFDGADVDGVVRSPDGAYMNQKKGIKFLPLYKVEKTFDRDIKSSVDYLR